MKNAATMSQKVKSFSLKANFLLGGCSGILETFLKTFHHLTLTKGNTFVKSNASRTAGQIHFTDMLPSKSAAAPVYQQAAIKANYGFGRPGDKYKSLLCCTCRTGIRQQRTWRDSGKHGALCVHSCLFHFLQAGECLLHSA